MRTVLEVLTVLLGIGNAFQLMQSIATGSSMKCSMQAAYNNWYRVAEIADQIKANPQNAAELIRHISGIADAERIEIVAYSREKLGFVPWHDLAWKPGPSPIPPPSLFQRIKSAFTSK
jgi:hypothetical protein